MIRPQFDIDAEKVEACCCRWKIRELSIFGLVLREDSKPDGDADVLVSFGRKVDIRSKIFRQNFVAAQRRPLYPVIAGLNPGSRDYV